MSPISPVTALRNCVTVFCATASPPLGAVAVALGARSKGLRQVETISNL